MQVYPVVPPQEPSGLDFRVDGAALEEVLDVVDTILEDLDILDVAIKVGSESQVPYPT